MRRIELLAGLAALCFVAGPALAHTPYLAPATFAPNRPMVTVEAALTEGNFFVPDMPIRGEGPYWATGPGGEAVEVKAVTALKEFSAIEVDLPTDGTYRISTGERGGRSTRWVKIDGAWKIVRPAGGPARGGGEGGERRPPMGGAPRSAPGGAPGAGPQGPGGGRFVEEKDVPAGAETMTSTSYIRAETYVTRGAPDRGALKPTGKGFEVEPVTHPNEVFAGEAFKFRLLNDGQPVPGVAFSIARAGDAYAEPRYAYNGKSDAAGAASVTFEQPGVYVLQAGYPARVEGAAEPTPRSTSYTLTFEVTR